MFNEIKNNIDTESIKSSLNKVKEDFQKGMENSIGNENTKGKLKESSTSNISSKGIESETQRKDNNDFSNDLESILDPSKSFDDPFDIIRHLNVSFKGNQKYHDVHRVRELIKPKMFGTTIWNSTIREQLIINEKTPQGELLPLGNVSYLGTIIKKELWFGMIDGDEGILFFPPTNYSPKKGWKSKVNFPEIMILNGKKELLSGKPKQHDWSKVIFEIEFGIFENGKQIIDGDSLITYNSNEKYFRVKYSETYQLYKINKNSIGLRD